MKPSHLATCISVALFRWAFRRALRTLMPPQTAIVHDEAPCTGALKEPASALSFPCKPSTSPVFVHLFSGAIAGGVSRTLTAPLDRLKAILQITRTRERVAAFATLQRLTREEGTLALFRGNGANCIKVVPECAIKFVAYDWLKRRLIQYRHSAEASQTDPEKSATNLPLSRSVETEAAVPLSLMEKFIAGGSAGAISQLVVYPMEVVKTRLATAQPRRYQGIIDCMRKMKKTEGMRIFYRGLLPSLLGIIPYAGIDLACFETFRRQYCTSRWGPEAQFKEPPIHVLLLAGAASSALGQIIAYPLALVRTRLQADGINGEPKHFRGMCDVFYRTVTTEGPQALYRGLVPNLLKAVPAVSVGWVVYETSKRAIESPPLIKIPTTPPTGYKLTNSRQQPLVTAATSTGGSAATTRMASH